MTVYPSLISEGILTPHDSIELARLLHTYYRNYHRNKSSRVLQDKRVQETLLEYARTLVADVRRGSLPPHPVANVHLLGYFKESTNLDIGAAFWGWLTDQDANCTDARTYGAAIELLARYGMPLSKLEDLYHQALKRFPGDFSEYQLAPEAIVSDRGAPTTTAGSRMMLQQGIITARILHGDWRRAYLALDAALRLYPDQTPGRMLDVMATSRPLSEAYQIFMMECRSGNAVRNTLATQIVGNLADMTRNEHSISVNLTITLALLNALRAYVGAGGSLHEHFITPVLEGLQGPLRALDPASTAPEALRIEGFVSRAVKYLVALPSVSKTLYTYTSLIRAISGTERPERLRWAIESLVSTEPPLAPSSRLYVRLLYAAGRLPEPSLIRDSWLGLINVHASDEEYRREGHGRDGLQYRSWSTLAFACRETDQLEFFREQLALHGARLSSAEKETLRTEVGWGKMHRHQPTPNGSAEEDLRPGSRASLLIDAIEQTFDATTAALELDAAGRVTHDFHAEPLPMAPDFLSLTQPSRARTYPRAYRQLYDKLTTDPSTTTTSTTSQATPDDADFPDWKPSVLFKTSTCVPFDVLRFENWVVINRLLIEASRHEAQELERAALDRSVQKPPDVGKDWYGQEKVLPRKRGQTPIDFALYGITDMEEGGEEWRKEVLRLRGLRIDADGRVQVLDKE